MIPTAVTHRIGWLATAALGALVVLVVALAPTGFDRGRPSRQTAVEYCRAEATRTYLVKYQATGQERFKDCMTHQGY